MGTIVDAPVVAANAGKDAASRAAFAFVFVTVLLDMLALGIMAPVLPKLVIDMPHGDIDAARLLGAPYLLAALLLLLSFLGSLRVAR